MNLHERVAKKLGWTVEQTKQFSLISLREIVRHVSPKLANDITESLSEDALLYVYEPDEPPTNFELP
jgi:hypothetical protein